MTETKLNNENEKLTAKQEAFCREYIIDLNGTQAAIRAGYSEKTAQQQAARLLLNVLVQKRISELKDKRNERTEINSDYVLKRLVEIDQLDILDIVDENGDLLPIKEWPKAWRVSVNGIDVIQMKSTEEIISYLKKIKMPDKIRNLELLGKHVNVGAFKEKLDISSLNANFELVVKMSDGGVACPPLAGSEDEINPERNV